MKEIKNTEIVSVEDLLGGASPAVRNAYQSAEDALEGAALIRTMRTMAKLSKSDLARKLGVKPARVSALEKGAGNQGPTYALLKRVARVCGLQFDLQKAIALPQAAAAFQMRPIIDDAPRTRKDAWGIPEHNIPLPTKEWWRAMLKRGKPEGDIYPMATQVKAVAKLRSKRHPHNQGTVKWFNASKGYGFISPDDGSTGVIFEVRASRKTTASTLKSGAKVVFEVGKSLRTQIRNSPKPYRK